MAEKARNRTQLALVIPTLNAGAQLGRCLDHVDDQKRQYCRIIVSDGGSDDETVDIARERGVDAVTGPPGRGGQLKRGADAADGTAWLLFIHADCHLPAGWRRVVDAHIASHTGAAAFRLAFRAPGVAPRIVAGWANFRSRLGLPYGDQGLLISARLYHSVGGYPDIALMEDVAIARALGGRIALLPATISTDAGKYLRHGWIRHGGRNMITLVRYLLGGDPAKLADDYARRARSE